jgi:peptidoglycan/xylan/chitin deacetylase (PgdA/CDA1 family)
MTPLLEVVMYHYIRDLPRTPFPRIKGMLLDDFRRQVRELSQAFEMATLESALAFLKGEYRPAKSLCLLTFDDGLKEHFSEVAPLLAESGISGVFFLITSAVDDHRVAPVHMNHFLMAGLDFDVYRRAFLNALETEYGVREEACPVDMDTARRTYPWDTPDVARFKYLFNFLLAPETRDGIVRSLFERHIQHESEFSQTLYLNWSEAREMQAMGMVLGGHSHCHQPLALLNEAALQADVETCHSRLLKNLHVQISWPFCYPYGKRNSYSHNVIHHLKRAQYNCAFTTESGMAAPAIDLFEIARVDCKYAGQPLG